MDRPPTDSTQAKKRRKLKEENTIFLGINNLLVGPEFWINTSGGRRDVMGKEHCG